MTKPARLDVPLAALLLTLAPSLLAQESKAILHAPVTVLETNSAPFQRLGDFDGDGDLDAVGTRNHQNGGQGQVYVWRNDNGAFTTVMSVATFGLGATYLGRSLGLAVADLNGDGLDDFVVATANQVDRYIAQPGMQFTVQPSPIPSAQPGPRSLCCGDFDNDGNADIALVAIGGGVGHLHAFLNSGTTATYQLPFSVSTTDRVRLACYDLDGQGGDDILLFRHNVNAANAYGVSGQQIVAQKQFSSTISSNTTTPWLWTGGDIDNDGDTDLVVFKPGSPPFLAAQYQVLRRTGVTTFTPEAPANGGPAEYLRDVDGDGDLDGVCCGGSGGTTYHWPKLDFGSTFEIAINDGTGNFAEAWSFPGAGSESMAGVADLDGDGDLELVAGRCVFYGNGPWDASPMPWAGGSLAYFQARRNQLHDVDRDGDPDYWGFRNRGDGVFEPGPVEPGPGAGSNYFGPGIDCDVDGDGARDRLRIVSGPVSGTGWLRNNGGGHFEYAGLVTAPNVTLGSPTLLGYDTYFVADFDGDGDEDVYTQGTGKLAWNDNGSFTAAPEVLPVAGDVDGVADFDGDGILDVAMHDGYNEIVLLGTGQRGNSVVQGWSLTFGAPLPFEPSATIVADVNGDGRADILRPWVDARLHLMVNETTQAGTPLFTTHTLDPYVWLSYPSPTTTERPKVTVADFDADGALDIGISRILGQPNTFVLLRRLTNDPNVHTYEELSFAIRDGYAADADGDGDVDLIGERTVRNRLVERDAAGHRMQKYSGVAGENGATPVLGGTGPYHAGGSHTLHLTGVPGPTVAIIGISILEANLPDNPLPGLTLYLDPAWMLFGPWPISQNGQGRAAAMSTLSLPIFPGTQGWTFYLQAFVPDGAATSGYTQTNLLSLCIGS